VTGVTGGRGDFSFHGIGIDSHMTQPREKLFPSKMDAWCVDGIGWIWIDSLGEVHALNPEDVYKKPEPEQK